MPSENLEELIDEVIRRLEIERLKMVSATDINGWSYKFSYNAKKDERLKVK